VPFDRGLPKAGQWAGAFALADVEGDRRLDLVHGPARKGGSLPVVFGGDGGGGWERRRDVAFPPAPYAYGDVVAGDWNGDGALDLALAAHLRGVVVLASDGRGSFGAPAVLPPRAPGALAVADVTGDGRADLVVLAAGAPGASGGLFVHPGDGRGGFRAGAAVGSGITGTSLAVADVDGDGRPDVVMGSSQLGRRDLVLLGREGGGFAPVEFDALPPRARVRAVAADDLDGDGRADLVVAAVAEDGDGWRTELAVIRWGTAERQVLARAAGRAGPTAVATGDLDGDGKRDVAALTSEGAVWLFLGDGQGGFARVAGGPPPFGPGCTGAHVALADLDGDGRDDVVAGFAEERTSTSAPGECPEEGGLAAWRTTVAVRR